MRREIKQLEMICNHCGERMEYATIYMRFGYPHAMDGDQVDFCSNECMMKWLSMWFETPEEDE